MGMFDKLTLLVTFNGRTHPVIARRIPGGPAVSVGLPFVAMTPVGKTAHACNAELYQNEDGSWEPSSRTVILNRSARVVDWKD